MITAIEMTGGKRPMYQKPIHPDGWFAIFADEEDALHFLRRARPPQSPRAEASSALGGANLVQTSDAHQDEPYLLLGCSVKKRTISLEASGPCGSV